MGVAKKYKGVYLKTRLILLVQKTLRGELASRIREQLLRFEPTTGFKIKVVEGTGAS